MEEHTTALLMWQLCVLRLHVEKTKSSKCITMIAKVLGYPARFMESRNTVPVDCDINEVTGPISGKSWVLMPWM